MHFCPMRATCSTHHHPSYNHSNIIWRGIYIIFVASLRLKVSFMRIFLYRVVSPVTWRTTPCRLTATAYSIYYQLHLLHTTKFSTSALDGSEWPVSRPDRFTPRNSTRYALDMWLGGRAPKPVRTLYGKKKSPTPAGHRTPNPRWQG
jgi:hypothetical protein